MWRRVSSRQARTSVVAFNIFERSALIDRAAVAYAALQRLVEHVAGRQHVMQQSDLAQIVVAAEMKTEEVVLQQVGDEIDELDLALDRETRAVLDLLRRQPGGLQQRVDGKPGLSGAGAGKPCQDTGSARRSTQPIGIDIARDTGQPRIKRLYRHAFLSAGLAGQTIWPTCSNHWHIIARRQASVVATRGRSRPHSRRRGGFVRP